jgi:Transposase DDE domain
MDPAQAVRFRNRSTAERVNSNLKDNYGGRFVRVRGAAKVMTHLMFGLIAITATQLFQLLNERKMNDIETLQFKRDCQVARMA